MTSKGDFHLHSTASDGVHTPTWVMETAAANGVRALSLTDHDSTEGLAEAQAAADQLGLRLIPGMELSVDLGKADVHLLGYGIDRKRTPTPGIPRMAARGQARPHAQDRRNPPGERHANPHRTGPGDRRRSDRGAATRRSGTARSGPRRQRSGGVRPLAWERQACRRRSPKIGAADAIKVVHENGGVVFIAHPTYMGDDYLASLATLRDLGADGIETYYKHYPADVVARCHSPPTWAMGASGGSDYHGLGNPDDRDIGDFVFPDAAIDAFLAFLETRGVRTGRQP